MDFGREPIEPHVLGQEASGDDVEARGTKRQRLCGGLDKRRPEPVVLGEQHRPVRVETYDCSGTQPTPEPIKDEPCPGGEVKGSLAPLRTERCQEHVLPTEVETKGVQEKRLLVSRRQPAEQLLD